ncbi:MAG: hypothetical protein FWH31_04970 [Streptococcaceae bacterium]|nr:hypothetical protein [Streptococcaceae bacterium]
MVKIIQGVHVNGTDRKKRYWIVPEKLEHIKVHEGMQAIVNTQNGYGRIRITKARGSKDNTMRWHGGKVIVTQEIIGYIPEDKEI